MDEQTATANSDELSLLIVEPADVWTAMAEKAYEEHTRTGELDSINIAVVAAARSVKITSEESDLLPGRLNIYGIMLDKRYERTGDMADLEAAIQAAQKAVDSAPDQPRRAMYLTNLGNKLGHRYEQTGDMADLEAAIQAAQQAVDSKPEDHLNLAACWNNLGNNLGSRYERTGDMADLEAAIQVAQKAVDSTPQDHPDRAMYLNNLGNKLGRRYERTGDRADLEKSGTSLLRAWKCHNSIPFRRVQAAARAVDILALLEDLKSAAQLAQNAINILPTVSTRFLQRADQQYAVSYFSGLAASACSILLRLNQPEQALEVLEKGRTTILSQLIGDRSDISTLRDAYPNLACQFESLLDRINAPLPSQDNEILLKQAQQRRRDGVAAFDSCVQEIQIIPGYERFLLGLTPAEMQACASEGPIVVVNVTDVGSHAIIVSSSEIKSLELPMLSPREARTWIDSKWSTGRQGLGSDNKHFREYLTWLWQVCVREVLIKCDSRVQQSMKDLPRIWWIGTGLASSMPFHAAGDHSPRSERNVFNRAISSYVPSIKALAYSRERLRKRKTHGENMLLATMTTTPGLPHLPGVEVEKEAILKVIPTHIESQVYEHPNAGRIIQSLEHCSIVHFACHGLSDYTDPSKSGLVFQKKDETGSLVQDAMSVHDVSELRLERAKVAYLSACSTAENGAARLRDEVIHVVSGFQVAGFPHVVGCLWPSVDAVCVEVAKEFYGAFFKEGAEMGDKAIAMALHEAVRAARARDWDQPLKWAQFVHYGA